MSRILAWATGVAGRGCGAAREVMPVPLSPDGSLEAVLRAVAGESETLFLFDRTAAYAETLRQPVRHRAIGVVYHPEREWPGNYVPTRLIDRYDALIFIPLTTPLTPLEG